MRETVDQQSETIEELKTKIEEILVRTEEQKTESEKAAKNLADLVRRFLDALASLELVMRVSKGVEDFS